MSDKIIDKLKSKYNAKNIIDTFGQALKSISIDGFRGLNSTVVKFEFPVTAISGLNGTGKSTIAQLAVCAYKKPTDISKIRRYYVKEFFPVSVIDPNPFSDKAKVAYNYATKAPLLFKHVTVSRKVSEWSGYKRQPERSCYYVGFTIYIPKVERRDLSIYSSNNIQVNDMRIISKEVKQQVSEILSSEYEYIGFQKVSHGNRVAELGVVKKHDSVYSENNMGFGEGRLLYMIDLLETAPCQSLFVLEEPETSLHETAQYKFSKYLLDVCNRKHHQIIITTHSSVILDALPPEARKYLLRYKTNVEIIDRVSASRAKSLLAEGFHKSLIICVEDSFAKTLLEETIRSYDPTILKNVQIQYFGDTKAVLNMVSVLSKLGINSIGVRDADKGESPSDKMYSLPGNLPPEKEVYLNETIQALIDQEYHIDIKKIMSLKSELDHHYYGSTFAHEAETTEILLNNFAIKHYIKLKGSDFFHELMHNICNCL